MTKRDILKFLERKQNEKKNAIYAEYVALRKQLLQNAYSTLGLPTLVGKVQPLLAEACRLWDEWEKEHENLDYITFHHSYYTLTGLVNSYTTSEDATFNKIVEEDISVEPVEVKNAYADYKIQRDCVNNTFHTVISTVQEMKNAKQAAIYLKELGFDLSEMNNPAEQVQTALMVPVDTRFLFVEAAA